MKHLALQISTVVAMLLSGTAAYAQQKTLYERLGGVFATSGGQPLQRCGREKPHRWPEIEESRTPKIWPDFRGSNSCARCGSPALRVDPSNIQPRNQAVLPLVWKQRIAN